MLKRYMEMFVLPSAKDGVWMFYRRSRVWIIGTLSRDDDDAGRNGT